MKKILSISLLFSSLVFIGACGNTENKEEKNSDINSSSEQKKAEEVDSSKATDIKFGLNEESFYNSDSENVMSLAVVKASTNQADFPDHMISLEEYDTNKMVAVTIQYKNLNLEEPFLPSGSEFTAYDRNSIALTPVNQQNGQDKIAIGRTANTTIFFELPIDGNEFNEMEIDYTPYGTNFTTTFAVPVTH
ncbi:hypothetical protein AB6878_12975 [Carnobacterium maltaromaticum]|uniref:hypothetical protein n=1 Tax=Carnobacterium maltaromaticum TaxID=2751 RepID=UPI0039BE2131